MAFLSGNPWFAPGLAALAIVLVWRSGPRGLVCVLMLGLAAAAANEFVAEPLKDGVGRARPYAALGDVILRVGRGNPLGSMPSAHALNAGLMAAVACLYYRRAAWWVVPIAIGIGVSRVYNGAHFPSDVLAGWGLGVASALIIVWMANLAWQRLGPRWAPRGFQRIPNLWSPERTWKASAAPPSPADGP